MLPHRWRPLVVTLVILGTAGVAGPAVGSEGELNTAVVMDRSLPSADDSPSRTGSETALGMIATLGALGIGGGLVATARRKKQ